MSLFASPPSARHAVLGDFRMRLLGLVVLMSMIVLLGVACSGGDDDDGDSTGSAPAATASTGSTGSTGPIGSTGSGSTGGSTTGAPGGSSAGGTGSTGGAGGDVPELEELSSLGSFRWDITMSGADALLGGAGLPSGPGTGGAADTTFTASGAYIAPDQAQVVISASGFEYKQTIKGDQQWTTVAGVTQGPIPASGPAQDLIYVSSFVDPENVVQSSDMDCGGTENVNGVQAVRCEASGEVTDQIAGSLPEGAQAENAAFVIWIAEDGDYIVRWEFTANGTANGEDFEWSFIANITDVGQVSSIEP